MKIYKIIRFYKDGLNKTIKTGLTLKEAKKHCKRKDTKGENWFDGYREMEC